MGTTTWPRGRRGVGPSLLTMDMKEESDCYCCRVDAPGCVKDDLTVSCDEQNNTITVMCNRPHDKDMEEKGTWITRERPRRRGQRTIYFDPNVDLSKTEVKFEHGCLCLKVPKKEKGAIGGRQLQIQ